MQNDATFMDRALELAERNSRSGRHGPFGADRQAAADFETEVADLLEEGRKLFENNRRILEKEIMKT